MRHKAFIVLFTEADDDTENLGSSRSTFYEIELNGRNYCSTMRGMLRHHLRTISGGRAPMPDEDTAANVRAWARKRKLPVSDRGRIPAQIWQQYEREHHDHPDHPPHHWTTVADAVNEAAQDYGENVVRLTGRTEVPKSEADKQTGKGEHRGATGANHRQCR
ncbi:Lsr2 family DNA-binding protein [Amycolatopsis anabasis]|uniref:Lsr2 family DNA-binding protein n=1 Tax=Amycolatopsis anabasis TaxID=1840409 RepID=UPI00131BEB68|nr:histone-like nucleoid-structuring protein Lsr2 [Amycolatopsis anabasis]